MKIVIDTNVILDILLQREPFFGDSYRAIRLCNHQADACFSASTATDIYYVVRKSCGADMAKESIGKLLQLFYCEDTLQGDIVSALSSKISDFEDAVLDSIAHRVKADYIITRNTKDFAASKVPAISPADFCKL